MTTIRFSVHRNPRKDADGNDTYQVRHECTHTINTAALEEHLKFHGIVRREVMETALTVLKDEMTVIGEDIQLIGRMDPVHTAKSVETLMRDCAPDPDKPILVLTHRPKDFAAMASSGCDLAMAGHTHGFNIPQFLGANMLGDMYYGSKAYDGMTAITTSGVSAWGYHYKWPAVSEVVTVHLTFTGAE